ncbi:MAG TPA: urease accessory protein UreD [Aliiroseovarius sp.]|nr:urease accessory protein UreD [Aliiroseovarius sp.]
MRESFIAPELTPTRAPAGQPQPQPQPRARGEVRLTVAAPARLARLRQSGSMRCLFPRAGADAREAVLVNTAGGITGGDRFAITARVAENAVLALTTQAAERAYRANQDAPGRMTSRLSAAPGARLHWLPQETILFDGCHYDRRLRVDLDPGARALIVEPLVFGRVATGEHLRSIRFRDRIDIREGGQPLFLDAMTITGDAQAHLARPHLAGGARALATLVLVAGEAEAMLEPVRRMLPDTGGASLVRQNVLVLRLLADDSFALRSHLVPILNLLTENTLPKCWTL